MRHVLVVSLVLLAGCGRRRSASVNIDPALLATLVSADTVLMAGAKTEALRGTPIYKQAHAAAVDAAFQGWTGLELSKVWEVLATFNGSDVAAMARGTFTSGGLEPELSGAGARTSYKGYTLIGVGGNAVVFVNPSTAVAGTPAAVRGVIDQRDRSSGPPATLAGEIAALPRESQVWAAGIGARLEEIAPRGGNLRNVATALKLVESFRASADLRAGAKVQVVALCRNDGDADSLAAALRTLLAFARMGNPALATLRIERRERTVEIGGAVPGAETGSVGRVRVEGGGPDGGVRRRRGRLPHQSSRGATKGSPTEALLAR